MVPAGVARLESIGETVKVEEAVLRKPSKRPMVVEVATPYPVVSEGMAAPPLPLPQAVPTFVMVPSAAKLAHPAVPPAEETMRLFVDAVPETVSAVLDA